jgi:hypothetical protein
MSDFIPSNQKSNGGRARATFNQLMSRWGRVHTIGRIEDPAQIEIHSMSEKPEIWVRVAKSVYELEE